MSEKNSDRDFSKISNAEIRNKLAIDINVDPYKIPIEELEEDELEISVPWEESGA